MGYRVKKYDLDELKKIALPGRVVPSLFWALPVGAWAQHDLDSLWDHFTKGDGHCKKFGLLLVREWGRGSRDDGDRLDLGGIAADLRDVIPGGARIGLPPDREGGRFLLFLSSAYPQPGWGLLVPIAHDVSATQFIRQLVSKAIDAFAQAEQRDLAVLSSAAADYHRWQQIQSRSPSEDSRAKKSRQDIESLLALLQAAEELIGALRGESPEDLARHLDRLSAAVRQSPNSGQDGEIPDILARQLRTLRGVRDARAVPHERLRDEIAPLFRQVEGDQEKIRLQIASLTDNPARNAFRALVDLGRRGLIDGDVLASIDKAFGESCNALAETSGKIRTSASAMLAETKAGLREMESEFGVAQDKYSGEQAKAHATMAASMRLAVQAQWQLGPRFLQAIEQNGAAPVVWDGPRMVGWKLYLAGAEITLEDLQIAAREMNVAPPEINANQGENPSRLIDGSYFTDYTHYIAMSSPSLHPRDVTRELLASLLKPNQLRKLVEHHGVVCPDDSDRDTRAELLIRCLGWPDNRRKQTGSLACFGRTMIGEHAALGDAELLALRMALESFCKDMLHVLSHQFGCSDMEIWSIIEHAAPGYRPQSRRRNWADEIQNSTAGSAAILIELLGAACRPEARPSFTELAGEIQQLAASLNPQMHDGRENPNMAAGRVPLAGQIRKTLDLAISLLGELPWHFSPTSQYGSVPRVLSGMGWSHAHEAPRLLRVLAFENEPAAEEILVWNKNGTNPVIADPVFLTGAMRRI